MNGSERVRRKILEARAGNVLENLRAGTALNARNEWRVSIVPYEGEIVREMLHDRTWRLGYDTTRQMLLRQRNCGVKTTAWILATYFDER